jgi:hypothetical protein
LRSVQPQGVTQTSAEGDVFAGHGRTAINANEVNEQKRAILGKAMEEGNLEFNL